MFYRAFKVVVRAVFFTLFRVKVIGKENADIQGSAVIYSNHLHALDPVFTHCILKRMPRYMAKKEVFNNKLLAWIVTKLGAFPVDRGHADMNSIKTAFKILHGGEILGIFPEGKRSLDGNMGEFLDGAATIAIRANAPLLPVYISRRMKLFHRTYVVVGKPFDLRERMKAISEADPNADVNATKIIRDEIIKLKESLEEQCRK